MKRLLLAILIVVTLSACDAQPSQPKPEVPPAQTVIVTLDGGKEVSVVAVGCVFYDATTLGCYGAADYIMVNYVLIVPVWVLQYNRDATVFYGQAQSWRIPAEEQ